MVKDHFTFGHQADAGCSYTDCAFDNYQKLHPKISTIHLCPGVVRTNWMLDLPCYVKCVANVCCGVCMCLCLATASTVGKTFVNVL